MMFASWRWRGDSYYTTTRHAAAVVNRHRLQPACDCRMIAGFEGGTMRFGRLTMLLASLTTMAVLAQTPAPTQPDWAKLQDETMQHYQALLRIDTRNPPGNETAVAEYLKRVLDKEGIPSQIVGSDPKRSNL